MTRVSQTHTTVLAVTVVLSVVTVGAFGIPGASAAGSSLGHGAENGNYTVNLPFDTDHYPAPENPGGPHNASINHFAASTQQVYDEAGAPDGLEKLEYIVIGNPDIDFSECSTSNTAAFGIDRDNDDPGTLTEVDLLSYLEKNKFNDSHIVVKLYDGEELGAKSREDKGGKETGREDGDKNPELYPDDEIVAHQGYRSSAGPCYRMPDEPGWYQINGKANGTSFSGSHGKIILPSHYFYICVCDSEREAYETLGPPPGQDNPYDTSASSGGSTPTPTPAPEQTATATPEPTEAPGGGDSSTPEPTATATAEPRDAETATPKPQGTATATPGENPDQPQGTATATPGENPDQPQGTATATPAPQQTERTGGQSQPQQNQQQPEGIRTPTAGAGPGFGVLAALGGLLALGLLARRR